MFYGRKDILAAVLAAAAFTAAVRSYAATPCEPPAIVYDTPAQDAKGAMVLGNGELGAIAWITADGVLHTMLQNSDSWNESAATP